MLSGTREKGTPKERSSSPREARSASRSRTRLLLTKSGCFRTEAFPSVLQPAPDQDHAGVSARDRELEP